MLNLLGRVGKIIAKNLRNANGLSFRTDYIVSAQKLKLLRIYILKFKMTKLNLTMEVFSIPRTQKIFI